jgi:carboxymethylenebutenolidase
MQRSLNSAKLRTDLLNSARYVKAHALSNGKLGAVGFCYGGGVINYLAVQMGGDLQAGVPFYGRTPKSEDVSKIKAAMMMHYAGNDQRINAGKDAYEAALKANNVDYAMYTYPGTRHGFNNNSTKRYDAEAAKLAWQRTIAHFKKHLS